MTEILRAFWKEKRPERIAVLVSGILFAVIFWIYEIPVEIAGYAFLLVILWNVIWFTLVFIRYEKRQRILEENQGKIRTEAGGFPEAESRESEMYQELIRQAVRKYSQMFIMTRTRLHLEIQDQKILTDEKWLTFVIEQILSNAVKYARGGEISIYTEDKILVIADDGIGIAEEDLPRIFEKGFTGYNGRANKKSTGIGLYLCKSIIDRLHHTIWIESKPEKGTKVYLNFDREHRRIE